MSKNHNKTGRTVWSVILTLVIAVSMLMVMIALTILTGLGNRDVLQNQINRSMYFDNVMEKMNSYIETSAKERNVSTDIFDGVITSRQINLDSGKYMSAVFNNENADIKTDKIEKKLWQRISEYMRIQNISMTDELKTSMDEWVNTIIRNYKSSVEFTFVEEYNEIRENYIGKVYIVLACSAVSTIISAFILFFMYRRKYVALSFVLDGTASASLIQVITTLTLGRIISLPQDFSNDKVYISIINDFLRNGINQGYYMVSVGVVTSVIMIVLIQFFRKKGDHRHG